jgi:hypothetical protein
MELLVKPEILRSYIYIDYIYVYGNAESRLFLFAAQCFNIESMQKLSCGTVVCKHFASYQGYPNYRWDLISYVKVQPLNTVKQQHPSTATSILTTKSTNRSLSAQRLSERTVLFQLDICFRNSTIRRFTSVSNRGVRTSATLSHASKPQFTAHVLQKENAARVIARTVRVPSLT